MYLIITHLNLADIFKAYLGFGEIWKWSNC